MDDSDIDWSPLGMEAEAIGESMVAPTLRG
jgi:hypothetical protein